MENPIEIWSVQILIPQQNMINIMKVTKRKPKNINP